MAAHRPGYTPGHDTQTLRRVLSSSSSPSSPAPRRRSRSRSRPTAVGSGGAAATVDLLGTRAAIDTLRGRRQRRRRRRGRRGRARRDRALLVRHRRRRLHGHPHARGQGHHDRLARGVAGRDAAGFVPRERSPAAVQRRALQRPLRRRAGHRGRLEPRPARVRHPVARRGAAAGDRHRPRRLHGRPDLRRPDQRRTSTSSTTFPPRPSSTSTRRHRRATWGPRSGTPTSRAPTSGSPSSGTKGFYRGAVADAMVEAAQNPPIAADANHTWRPGLMTMRDLHRYAAIEREPTHVGYRGLDVWGMGPPSSGGSTVGEALNILEGYDLSPTDPPTFASASGAASVPRVVALLVRGPQRLAGRPGLLRRPARRAALRRVRRRAPGADQIPPRAADQPGAGRQPEARSQSTTHLVVSDDEGTVVSYTFTIESTGGNGIVVPGWGFLLNNELTDFNFDSLTHPNRADGDKRPRSSMSPTIVTRRRRAVPRGRLPGRLDDHHDRAAGAARAPRPRQDPAARRSPRRGRASATPPPRRPSRRSSHRPRARRSTTTPATATPSRCPAEIGAVTGIEFLGGGRVLAAAEPVRRGGGHAETTTSP